MTQKKFNQTRFSKGTIILHTLTDRLFDVIAVDFGEHLIGVSEEKYYSNINPKPGDVCVNVKWLRCENCKVIG